MDPESVSKAKPRFTQEVLEKFLKPELKLVEKIAVVDFVNSGGSIANASQWIQDFAQEIEHPLKVQVLSYGNGVPSDIEAILGKSSISVKHLSFGMSEGSPTKLASGSLLEHFAPYGEWNPITTTENPKFNTTIRRDYPYLVNGKKEYSQYASYEDLVEWLKKEEFKPQLPSPQNCLFNTLGGML